MPLYTNKRSKWQQRGLMTSLGTLQGILIWYFSYTLGGYTSKPLLIFAQSFTLITIFLIQFLWNAKHIKSMALLSIFCGIIIAYTSYQTQSQLFDDAGVQRGWNSGLGAGTGSYFILAVLTFICAPFLKIFHRRRNFRFPYIELMNNAWSLVILTFYAIFFTIVAWGALYLWISLFKTANIHSLNWILSNESWLYIFSLSCFGYFFAVARDHTRAIAYLYTNITRTCSLVLPLLSVTLALFLFTLIFTGLYKELDLQFSATTAILFLIGITVITYNGVYKDCHSNCPYPQWVQFIIKASILTLPVFALLALSSLDLRIDQYGLTIPRVWAFLFTVLSLFYSVGYAYSILKHPDNWMRLVSTTNIYGAIISVCMLLIMHTPMFDPANLSANNQYKRFINNRVSAHDFDYGYLEFEIGAIGKEYLSKIRKIKRPDSEYIERTISHLKSTTFYDWKRFKEQSKLVRDVGLGRLEAHKINYAFLRFNMKNAGNELLNRLMRMEYHPQYNIIESHINELSFFNSWEEWNQRIPEHHPVFNPSPTSKWDFDWEVE